MVPAVIVESWLIKDPKNDKANVLGYNLPEGTWFASVHIEDTEYWNNNIKTGKFLGFSIEGFLGLAMNTNKNEIKIEMKEYKTQDGAIVKVDGELVVGSKVMTVDASGADVPIVDGEYTLEDGTVIKVTAGAIEEVSAPQAQAEVPATVETPLALDPAILAEVSKMLDAHKAEVEGMISQLNDKILALEASIANEQATNAEMSKVNTEMKAQLENFSKTIAGKSKTDFSDEVKKVDLAKDKFKSDLERLEEFRKASK